MVFEPQTIEIVVTDRRTSNCQTYQLNNVPNIFVTPTNPKRLTSSLVCQLLKHLSNSDYIIMRKEIGAFVTNLVKNIAMNVQEEVWAPTHSNRRIRLT